MSNFLFDANLCKMKNSVPIMKICAHETEIMIKKAVNDYLNSEGPRMHTIELDHGIDEEYYSYNQFSSYCFEDVQDMYTTTLPNLMRRSTFLTIYGIFEYNISRYCSLLMKNIKFPLKFSDLNKGTIERADLFLTKVILMEKTEKTNRENLNSITQVRHLFTHFDGDINPNDKKIVSAIDKLTKVKDCGVSLSLDKQVILSESFLSFVIDVIECYFNSIEKAVYAYMKNDQ